MIHLAVSYDTEQAVPNSLPLHIVSPKEYAQLPRAEQKNLWADYLRENIWEDPEHSQRSLIELEMVRNLDDLFTRKGGRFTSFILGRWLDFVVRDFGQEKVRGFF